MLTVPQEQEVPLLGKHQGRSGGRGSRKVWARAFPVVSMGRTGVGGRQAGRQA